MTTNRSFATARQYAFCLVFGLASTTTTGDSLDAHETLEPLSDVYVEQAVATTAEVGGTTRVRFVLDNLSGNDVTLVGAEAPLATSGALVLHTGDGETRDVPIFLIKDQEVLDLSTSHIWIELRGLRQPLSDDDEFHFELIFRKGAVAATAHVHTDHAETVQ